MLKWSCSWTFMCSRALIVVCKCWGDWAVRGTCLDAHMLLYSHMLMFSHMLICSHASTLEWSHIYLLWWSHASTLTCSRVCLLRCLHVYMLTCLHAWMIKCSPARMLTCLHVLDAHMFTWSDVRMLIPFVDCTWPVDEL